MGNHAPAEILQVIFSHIVEPQGCPLLPSPDFHSDELIARKTLAACALVCRAWTECARTALYRRLYLSDITEKAACSLLRTLVTRKYLRKHVVSLVLHVGHELQIKPATCRKLFIRVPHLVYFALDASAALKSKVEVEYMPTSRNNKALTHLAIIGTGKTRFSDQVVLDLPLAITHLASKCCFVPGAHHLFLGALLYLHFEDDCECQYECKCIRPTDYHSLECPQLQKTVFVNVRPGQALTILQACVVRPIRHLRFEKTKSTTLLYLELTLAEWVQKRKLERLDVFGPLTELDRNAIPNTMPYINWIGAPDMQLVLPLLLTFSSGNEGLLRLRALPWITTTDPAYLDETKPYMEAARQATLALMARGLKVGERPVPSKPISPEFVVFPVDM